MAIFSAINAGKARKAQGRANDALNQAIADRPDIINPYENVTDLSGMISNPFANLQVATGAAEFQAEQADMSLANVLDQQRALGGGASSATAIAQAAVQSKRNVADSIQQQEAQNARLRAQGEQQAQGRRLAEAQRLQQADILGKTFKFQAEESRSIADIARQAGLAQQFGQQRMDALAGMGANTAGVLAGIFGN
tara:strand:- start:4446 stop:5030 length:585 start_codon:yes stop_codon:yes gene_type:complete